MRKLLTIILMLSFSQMALANNEFCSNKELASLPVQAQGRVKPYLILAKESLRFITGKTSLGDMPATEAFCLISFSTFTETTPLVLNVTIEHEKVRDFLSLKEKQAPISSLVGKKQLIASEVQTLKMKDAYKKSLTQLWNQIELYENIIDGKIWTLPLTQEDKIIWHSLSDMHQHGDTSEVIQNKLLTAKSAFITAQGDNYLWEVTLEKSHIFSIAMLLALIAIFVVAMSRKIWPAQVLVVLILITQVLGMTMRVLVSGRAPITNMYETVMFSGFGALLIALILTLFKKEKMYLLGGLGYNILCLFMMQFAHNMLDPSISPLVPVLRDNFWLSTHVTTIILSYAALALSWMMANVVLVKNSFRKMEMKDINHYQTIIYNSIKVAVVLLSAGIILGGVWADYSWGRFWGWDPKETWSLIVLLIYMALLHGRYTNWITPKRFIIGSAAGFMSVMMAWFGVNYILATGLHSYGFSEGGALFLGGFFLIQTVLLIITGRKLARN